MSQGHQAPSPRGRRRLAVLLLVAVTVAFVTPPPRATSAPAPQPAPVHTDAPSPGWLLAGLADRLAHLTAPLAPILPAPSPAALDRPQPHFGFSQSAPLAQATGTAVPLTPTGTMQPVGTATVVTTGTPPPSGTPGVQGIPIYPSRGELVPGRATALEPPRGYRLQAARPAPVPAAVTDQCAPNVQVSAQVNSLQALQVTLTAGGAGNHIQRVYFPRQNAQNPGDRFTNAVVSFTDQAVSAEILDVTYVLTPPVAALTLFVTAVVPGQPTHVPLVVTDDCGDWTTFVGGGPNAGLTCLRVEGVPSGTEHNPPYLHAGTVGGVHTLTGSFSTSHPDLTSAGVGPTPWLTRTYNSNDPRPGPLGQGWTHNYATHLARPPDGTQDLVLVGSQGRSDRYQFTGDPNGVYGLPPGVLTRLQRRADGTYLATAPDQSTLTFDACGRLTALADRYGNVVTLFYDAATARLLLVNDPAGRGSLEFAYDALTGRLRSVTDWIARQVRYEYDPSGRLWKVTDRQGAVTTFGYDGTSMRLATIDDGRSPSVRVLTLAYGATRRVAWTRDALDYQTTFDYGTGNGATVTLPFAAYDPTRAPQVIDAYQAQGWLSTRTTKPTSFETFTVSYTYDASGNRTSETDANGHTTTYCYDVDYAGQPIPGSRGNLTRKILPAVTAGRTMRPTWLYRYDSRNNLLEEYSPNGVWTDEHVGCATDVRGLLLGNYLVRRQYDERNQLVAVTRQFTDPDLGLLTAITKYEYHATYHGQVVTEIPPRGNTNPNTPDYTYATRHTYYAAPDAQAGMRQDTTDPTGNRTSYTYDAMGRRLTQVEPRGHVAGANPAQYTWTFAYDNEDRLIEQSAPDPNGNTNPPAPLRTRYGYDAVGNRTSVTDARGQITRYVYDAANRLVEVQESPTSLDPLQDPHRELARYSYDPLGNLQQIKRQLASDAGPKRLFDYRYDGLGRLREEKEYPQTGVATWTYTYDGPGNRTRVNKPLGTITYQYDAANRLTAIDYSTTPANPDVQFTYDANGNRRTMSGSAAGPSAPTTYLYDERDALTQVTFGTLNKTVGYRYDLDGQRRQLLYPNGDRLTYERDTAGRVTLLADSADPSRRTSYEYWANGRLRSIAHPTPNRTTHQRTYDYAARLRAVENRFANGALITRDSYGCEGETTTCLDPIGNPTRLAGAAARATGSLATYTVTFAYDGLNRLTRFDQNDSRSEVGTILRRFDFAGMNNQYAATNNRAQVTDNLGTATYHYDGADRMTTVTPPGLPPGTYTYDADGNAYGAPCNLYLSHDLEDRFGTHDDACGHDPVITELRYDATGLLQQKSGAATNEYVWDVALPVPQLLQDASLRYVYGPGGIEYATTLDGRSVLYFYHLDGQGSVRALSAGTTTATTVLFSTSYDPYGVPLFQESTLGTGQPFGYTGAVFDPDFQFHYLRARWYNPKSGRFLQRDSVRGALAAPGSLHRYAYAHHNPLAYHDPSGHDPWWNDPDFATPLNWGCGPHFPGCLFGLGSLNDLAWTLDAGFTPWLPGAVGPRPASGGGLLWRSYSGWDIHQNVLARLADPRQVGPLAGRLAPSDLPPLLNAPGTRYYFDARTSNINALPLMDTLLIDSQFRITLALDRPAIISVGLVRDRDFRRYLRTGTWVPLEIAPPGVP